MAIPYEPLTQGARPTNPNWMEDPERLLAMLNQQKQEQINQLDAMGIFGGIRNSPRNPGGSQNTGIDWLKQNYNPANNPAEQPAPQGGFGSGRFGYQGEAMPSTSPAPANYGLPEFNAQNFPLDAPQGGPSWRPQPAAPMPQTSPSPDTPQADAILGSLPPNAVKQFYDELAYRVSAGEDLSLMLTEGLNRGYLTPDEAERYGSPGAMPKAQAQPSGVSKPPADTNARFGATGKVPGSISYEPQGLIEKEIYDYYDLADNLDPLINWIVGGQPNWLQRLGNTRKSAASDMLNWFRGL